MTGSYKPRPAGSLKAAQDRLIAACGGLERAAEMACRSRTRMAGYSDPGEPDRHMPAHVVRALERAADYPHVTAYLAREAGYAMRPAVARGGALPGLLGDAQRETADVIETALDGLADMQLSPAEAGRVIAEIDEALTALQRLRARCQAVRDGNRPGADDKKTVTSLARRRGGQA